MAQLLKIDEFRNIFNPKLKKALKTEEEKLAKLSSSSGELAVCMSDLIVRDGKRSRPYLFYITYCGYGGDFKKFPWELAIAIELYHQFLLIHDDVIDHDTLRHKGPNITGYYLEHLPGGSRRKRQETAEAMAVLGGDLSFSMVYDLINQSLLDPALKVCLGAYLHEVTRKEVAGQQLDVLFNFKDIAETSLDDITKMYLYKTSAYTFELPLLWAAELSGVPAEEQGKLGEFAKICGLIYQITDDMIGIFSEPEITGKPVGSDIREDKKTVIMRLAYESMPSTAWRNIAAVSGERISQQDVSKVRSLLQEHKIDAKVLKFVERLVKDAKKLLDGLTLDQESYQSIELLLSSLSTRRA